MIEIQQSWTIMLCSKCNKTIMQGELFLHTRNMKDSWYYCRYCGINKYAYTRGDYETFRPNGEVLGEVNYDKYDDFNHLKFSLWSIK